MSKRGNENNFNDGVKILMKYKTKKDFERKNRKDNNLESNDVYSKKISFIGKLIIIAIFIIIIILFYIFIRYSSLIGIHIIDFPKKSKENIVNVDSYCSKYNNNLLLLNENIINIYDRNFNTKSKYDLGNIDKKIIVNNDKYIIIGDISTSRIYFFTNLNNVINKKIVGKIEKLYLDDYGNFSVDYIDSQNKKKIDIFNKKGNLIYTITPGDNNIYNICSADNLNKIIMLKSYTEGLKFSTKIDYIKNKSNLEELMVLENKYVYDIKIFNDKIILLTNDEILEISLVSKEKKIIYNLMESQISSVNFHDSYLSIIHMKDNKYFYTTYTYDFTEVGNLEIEKLPKYVKDDKYISYLVYDNKIIAINKWGTKIKEFNILTIPSELVIFNDGKSIALIYSYKIEILNI